MKIAHAPSQLERQPRAVAIGAFDGVHRGHRGVLQTAVDTGLAATVVTFDPHPRIAFGHRVELITTLERRLELLEEAGVEATLIVGFTPEVMRLEPEAFAEEYLRGDRRRGRSSPALTSASGTGAAATSSSSSASASRCGRHPRWRVSRPRRSAPSSRRVTCRRPRSCLGGHPSSTG